MFFPGIINQSKGNIAFQCIIQFSSFCCQIFIQVGQCLDLLFTICKWYGYIFNMITLF